MIGPSKMMILVLVAVFIAMTINCAQAYRLDNAHTQMLDSDDHNPLDDPYMIERLEALLAILTTANHERAMIKELDELEHLRSTRLAANRRPGLLRLRKDE
jgi:hypothetical protein